MQPRAVYDQSMTSPAQEARVVPFSTGTTVNCYHTKLQLVHGGNRSGEVSYGMNWIYTGPTGPSGTDYTNLKTNVVNFLNHVPSGATNSPAWYISNSCSRAVNASSYDLYGVLPAATDPGKLGPPIDTSAFTLNPPTPAAAAPRMPEDLACCVSMRADYGTDEEFGTATRPRADDRGRFYFGPLHNSVASQEGIGLQYFCFDAGFLTDLGTAYKSMVDVLTPLSWLAAVWSRKEKVFKPAIFYMVNNHPDSQRKRQSLVDKSNWLTL